MADRPLIPATEALLDGWWGPVSVATDKHDDGPWSTLGAQGFDGWYLFPGAGQGHWIELDLIRLDPARREVAHRVVDVAREVYGVDLSALLDQPAALAEAWRGLVGGERG